MWETLASLKENLSQIALDVQVAAEELDGYGSPPAGGEDGSASDDRRASHRFAQSKSPLRASTPSRNGSPLQPDLERYKDQIQRLQSSEAEIKALSLNYAAMLREKEEELLKLYDENSLLKKNLDTRVVIDGSKNGSPKTSLNGPRSLKGNSEQTSNKHQKNTIGISNHSFGNHSQKAAVIRHDKSSNGTTHTLNLAGEEKENFFEEHNYEKESRALQNELEKERGNLSALSLELQGAQKMNEVSKKELQTLILDKDRMSAEMKNVQKELTEKKIEMKRLQEELIRRDKDESNMPIEYLKSSITALEKDNANLKAEKSELLATLRDHQIRKSDGSTHHSDDLSKLESQVAKLENDLKNVTLEKDKAMQELSRLKQHLLDKELEESEKMDEDSKMIEELQAKCESQRAQILHIEKALKHAISSQEEAKKHNIDELQQANETIMDLKRQLAACMSTVEAKNIELLNLQTALGQYYAETEAKERLGRDLVVARDELNKFSELLKEAHDKLEMERKEKEEFSSKLLQVDRIVSESKLRMQKLDDENQKLRRVLEQSMTRLNRMSVDSDFLVDRRIVIKLLVTYLQRNHSKEVLDLMVRMLGFSEEDKQRIGFAQQTSGRSVVRGVLGLPGRLVGGIMGGGSSLEKPGHAPMDNESFADLWVDFLLKETEEREKREFAEAALAGSENAGTSSSARLSLISDQQQQINTSSSVSPFSATNYSYSNAQNPVYERGRQPSWQSDNEFLNVPLTHSTSSSTSDNSSRFSRSPFRY